MSRYLEEQAPRLNESCCNCLGDQWECIDAENDGNGNSKYVYICRANVSYQDGIEPSELFECGNKETVIQDDERE